MTEYIPGIVDQCKKYGVWKEGHFVYTSWRHGAFYFNKDAIYPHTSFTARLARRISEEFFDLDIHAVVAPAVGGCILSHRVADRLSMLIQQGEVLALYADKSDDDFVLRRGYDKAIKGLNTLVVEDTINTGGSTRKVIAAVRKNGGNVVGVGSICSYGSVTKKTLDVLRFQSLIVNPTTVYEPEDCPLCAKGIEVNTEVGHGKQFLELRGVKLEDII